MMRGLVTRLSAPQRERPGLQAAESYLRALPSRPAVVGFDVL